MVQFGVRVDKIRFSLQQGITLNNVVMLLNFVVVFFDLLRSSVLFIVMHVFFVFLTC